MNRQSVHRADVAQLEIPGHLSQKLTDRIGMIGLATRSGATEASAEIKPDTPLERLGRPPRDYPSKRTVLYKKAYRISSYKDAADIWRFEN